MTITVTTLTDLEAHLAQVRATLALIPAQVVIRATLPANAAYPQSASHLILDLVPTAPTSTMDGSVIEDLALQVGAWSLESLVSAIALADAARTRMRSLGYTRTGGASLATEDAYHGVICTYTLTGAFDALT